MEKICIRKIEFDIFQEVSYGYYLFALFAVSGKLGTNYPIHLLGTIKSNMADEGCLSECKQQI